MYKSLPQEDSEQQQARLRKEQRELDSKVRIDCEETPMQIEDAYERIEKKRTIKKMKLKNIKKGKR